MNPAWLLALLVVPAAVAQLSVLRTYDTEVELRDDPLVAGAESSLLLRVTSGCTAPAVAYPEARYAVAWRAPPNTTITGPDVLVMPMETCTTGSSIHYFQEYKINASMAAPALKRLAGFVSFQPLDATAEAIGTPPEADFTVSVAPALVVDGDVGPAKGPDGDDVVLPGPSLVFLALGMLGAAVAARRR